MQFLNIEELSLALKKRNKILTELEELVNQKGYIKVEPDYFEPYERFIHMNKRIKKESMVKILNQDGSISILRPDITTNIIKQIIPKWSNSSELKVYYIASTFSQSLMQPLQETRQFGVEYLGSSDTADQDIIKLILSIFKSFDMSFILEISHQSFLNALISSLNLSEDEEEKLKNIIDHKNQYEMISFVNSKNISKNNQEILLNLFNLQGNLVGILNKLDNYTLNSTMKNALIKLKKLEDELKRENLLDQTSFDLSLMSKYDYYDGITFKGYINQIPFPILSGGRYDLLTKEFGKDVPATGFSLNLTELIKEVLK